MVKKKEINTQLAPVPGGYYSQAIEAANIVYISGTGSVDMSTGKLINDDYEKAFRVCFTNIANICKAAGSDINNIVMLKIFSPYLESSSYLEKVLPEFFTKPYPSRSRVFTSLLPDKGLIEIEAILVK